MNDTVTDTQTKVALDFSFLMGDDESPATTQPRTSTIDDIVRNIVNESLDGYVPNEFDFDDIIEDVRKVAVQEIDDYDFDDIVERSVDNLDIENRVENIIENLMPYGSGFDDIVTKNNFDPSDYDLVTDEAFSSFREEIEGAIQNIKDGNGDPIDSDALTNAIGDIEGRLTAIENTLSNIMDSIREFGGSM